MTAQQQLRERIRSEISHNISPVIGWLRQDAVSGRVDNGQERLSEYQERVDKAVDAILKLVEQPTTSRLIEETPRGGW